MLSQPCPVQNPLSCVLKRKQSSDEGFIYLYFHPPTTDCFQGSWNCQTAFRADVSEQSGQRDGITYFSNLAEALEHDPTPPKK